MRRSAKIKLAQGVRKPVSFAIERVFPASRPGWREGDTPAGVSAVPRVRDSLVLRLVAKKKVTKAGGDEQRAH